MSDHTDIVDREIGNLQSKGLSVIKQMIGDLLLSLVRPLATLTEVTYRSDLGERYFTTWNVGVGIVLLSLAMMPPTAIKLGVFVPWGIFSTMYAWSGADFLTFMAGATWLVGFVLAARRERQSLRQRYRDGVVWHSYSCGTSDFDEQVPAVYHGLIAAALGVALIVMGLYGPGFLLLLSGHFSAQMRQHEIKRFHHQMLDAIDAQVESKNLSQAIMERSRPQDTEGFAARLPAYVSDKFRERFVQRAMPTKTAPKTDVPASPAAAVEPT